MEANQKDSHPDHGSPAARHQAHEQQRIDVDVESNEVVEIIVRDGEIDIEVESADGERTMVAVQAGHQSAGGHGENGCKDHGGHGEHHCHHQSLCVVELISVNEREVRIHAHEATGLQIKQAAISAGVPIQLEFVLAEEHSDGTSTIVGNEDVVNLREGMKFSAIRDDDNS